MLKKIMLVLLAAFIVIQFIHPQRNQANGAQPNYIGNKYFTPEDVKTILAKACNDCHSNNTEYPWYTYFQPVHWWLNDHIKDGKKELNLDEYNNKSLRHQYRKMEEVIDEVKEGEMPFKDYTRIHKTARLTVEERTKITNWAQSIMDTLRARHPLDSLIKKK